MALVDYQVDCYQICEQICQEKHGQKKQAFGPPIMYKDFCTHVHHVSSSHDLAPPGPAEFTTSAVHMCYRT